MADAEKGFDKDRVRARMNEAFADSLVQFNNALALRAVDCGPGWATMRLPYDGKLVGNPDTGVLHGGVITSLMDAACGMSVMMKLRKPTRVATLDLRIDYLKPATPPEAVHARAECYKVTRQVAFIRGLAYHDDPNDPIASAAGTFMIFGDGSAAVGSRLRDKEGE